MKKDKFTKFDYVLCMILLVWITSYVIDKASDCWVGWATFLSAIILFFVCLCGIIEKK